MIVRNERILTDEEVLLHISDFIHRMGYSPTVRELCMLTGKSSPSTIHAHLKKLKESGYITYKEKKERTIRIK